MELFRSRSLFPLHGLRKKVGMCFVARSRCGSVGSIAIYRVCAFVVFRHELQNSSCCDRNGGLHQCVRQLWMAARCIEFVEFVLLLLLLKRSRNQSLSKANQ